MKFASQLSIQSKLMVMLLTVSIASILVIGFVGYQGGREALMQNLSAQMSQLRITRTRQIVDYFTDLQNQVVTLAEDPSLMAATIAFQTTFNQLDDQLKNPQPDTQLNNQPDQPNLSPQELSQLWLFYQQSFIPRLAENVEGTPTVKPYFPKSAIARYLQYHYIAANSYPVESKSRLENPEDGSEYSKIHRQFHPFLRDLSERFQYQNLMLIDSKTGNVIYEVAKQVGFATSVTQDSFVNSGVAALFKTLKDRGEPRTFAVADFNPFRPNAGKPAAFVGAPVFREGNLTGILVLQLPVDQINRIMTGNSQWPADGLGQTGETVLVGPDLLLRSPSRFLMEEPEGYFQDLEGPKRFP
ncbi:MAG: hypothetical protein HC825_04165 [Oscillatoriales cyanobacterium RM1_1_9]|nr:hypothetical protein [Oscillatoriales cyanobacterium RM1_1_9]